MVPARKLVTLNYRRALKADTRSPGKVPVFGTNGQCGWHDAPLAKAPGLILGRKGQGPLGVEWCDKDFWVIDTAYYASTLTPDIDLKYLYHLVNYVGLNHLKDGTSNPTLSRDTFGAQLFPLPSLAEQKAIAAVLGALDDKIELNRRMNATLEAMARALFQSWFVDFDPVRAKLDGRPPAALDPAPAAAALFPEHLEDSPLGHIPKGWKAGTVVEGFNLTMGQSPPGDTYNEEGNGLPFYQGRTDFGFRFPTRRIYCTAPTRYAKPGDTLVRVRAPVGDINMANEECCIGRGVAAVRHKSGATSFTYHSMANLYPDFARFEAEGTVFGSINKDSFEQLRFVIPPDEIVAAYERQAGPLDEQIRTLENQSRTLATLRDTLLPKLLSGELSVAATDKESLSVQKTSNGR
jgi:type I restriction enzyme S subunit